MRFNYGRHSIDDSDISAVTDVLKSDWLTQGPKIEEFEKALGGLLGAQYATAVCNGTAGLHLIALSLGWEKGDIVLTSPLSFVASSNCVLYTGATVDFVDIDPSSYTLDIRKLEEKILEHEKRGNKIKAVIGVDYAGHPCDWPRMHELSSKHGFKLVNDFCHALGAELHGDTAYGTKYAHAVNLSFHPVKHITTGEGGAILTNESSVSRMTKLLRTHGITREDFEENENNGPWYYEMVELGYNFRITDFQCALGLNQLTRLSAFLEKRRKIAALYDRAFRTDERFNVPVVKSSCKHAYHIYPLQINFRKITKSKKDIFLELREKNVFCQVHYIPIHLQPYYRRKFGFRMGDFPRAEEFYAREMSIPIYPGLDENDVEYIVKAIKEVVR